MIAEGRVRFNHNIISRIAAGHSFSMLSSKVQVIEMLRKGYFGQIVHVVLSSDVP